MSKLIVDRRDQEFVLYEMFNIEELCATDRYREFSREMFDMTLQLAEQMGEEVLFPTYGVGDREGCKLVDGSVQIPKCYHAAHKAMNEAGLFTMGVSPESGGQGVPYVVESACREYFIHNMGFFLYPEAAVGAAHMIDVFGTEAQKRKYMDQMYAGKWGGTMVLTEPDAGSDVGNLKARAIRQPDGTFRIVGSKIFISCGDSDLFENIVHPVLARIEGDPAGTAGISIFLVPKYLVCADGSLGKRNDYSIVNVEHKMGLKGNATCAMSFGDNGECYAELLGQERQGMKIMFQMMNEARIGMGIQGVGTASVAYLHALRYAKERIQGKKLSELTNPAAKNVAIVNHPDVRRMLLWMKSHVEGMRALVYLCAYAIDRRHAMQGQEAEKWHGIMELLIPICKAYNTDMGFRVCELAIQIYGGYGYCNDYPVEQFLRDLKIGSIYEGTNGIQALDLVGRKIGQKGGLNFMSFFNEMNLTIASCEERPGLSELAGEVRKAVNTLGETAMFFSQCGQEGKVLVPAVNATPFLAMMGNVCLGWLLLWQASIADGKLSALLDEAKVDPQDERAVRKYCQNSSEGAFYQGKLMTARFYINNVLPEAIAVARAIKREDLSVVHILEESFG